MTLTLLPAQKGIPISPSLIGINIELTDLCAILRMDTVHQETFERLFTNFGVGTLHIGGHSADESIWQPDAKPVCLKKPIVTQSLVQSVFAFARRIYWTVLWGLNLRSTTHKSMRTKLPMFLLLAEASCLGFTMENYRAFCKTWIAPGRMGI